MCVRSSSTSGEVPASPLTPGGDSTCQQHQRIRHPRPQGFRWCAAGHGRCRTVKDRTASRHTRPRGRFGAGWACPASEIDLVGIAKRKRKRHHWSALNHVRPSFSLIAPATTELNGVYLRTQSGFGTKCPRPPPTAHNPLRATYERCRKRHRAILATKRHGWLTFRLHECDADTPSIDQGVCRAF